MFLSLFYIIALCGICSSPIQTVDDSIPELKRDFSLILASITGGALIDSTNGANQASITVVASDSPFGIFEFQQPLQVTVDEDVQEVRGTFPLLLCSCYAILT